MQPGGGGGGPSRVGPAGRAPSTSSAAASPSSSSSAVSTPQLGIDSLQHQHQQQFLGSRQTFQHQMLRKSEGNENHLGYQVGGFQGVIGGNNFGSSSGTLQRNQSSRKFVDVPQQYGSSTQDIHNRGQSSDQQPSNSVHQAYMQFAANQQKSFSQLQSQQQAKVGMLGPGSSKDQEMRMGNMKMQELLSIQAANQFSASSKNFGEPFSRIDKQADYGPLGVLDARNEDKSISLAATQPIASNPVRSLPGTQSNQTLPSTGNNQLALAQAMRAWALERNIDLTLPANANMMSQLVPFMQSRMDLQQNASDSHPAPILSSSCPPPKPQVTSPSVVSENSQHADSSGDASGPHYFGKSRPGVASSSFGASSPGAGNTQNILIQQLAFNSRDNQIPSRPASGLGNGMLHLHPPQSSGTIGQSSYQSAPPAMSNSPETTSIHQLRQLNWSTPQSAGISSDGYSSPVPASQQRVGFTKQQLHVLKVQILAFRRLKKGESTLPQELLRAIAPPPLEAQLQAQVNASGMNMQEKPSLMVSEDRARIKESKERAVQSSSSNGPALSKQEMFVVDEKPSLMNTQRQTSPVVVKESPPTLNTAKDERQIVQVPDMVDQEADDGLNKAPIRSDDRGKSVASEYSISDSNQTKKISQPSSQSKESNAARKYHGPLFDFPFFTRKHDSVGTSGMVNALTLAYDVKDILCEDGFEALYKRRRENLKKIKILLAVNLERKRIRPDLVLRLQIEEKKLKLSDLQSRLRDEVDQQQQEIMAMPDRPYRKFVRLCERQRVELFRQVQASQKALREKQWKSIFQWRKKLLEAHWAIRDSRTARNRGVAKYHERMLREFSKRKDDDRNKRMEALKNNDVERYREMLMEQQTSIPGDAAERYAVLSSFLTQTEDYLNKLGSKITATKNQQDVEEAANAAAAAARLQGLSEEEVKAAASCAGEEVMIRNRFMEMNAPKDGSSVRKYYALAHAVTERVSRQPSMLRAGTLRDYQLVGLQWMLSLYNNKLNGILADEMGLGKTVQVMSLIAYLMEFKGNYGPHLIIVPNAVLVNWKSEFLNWLPSVSCIFYVGGKEQRAKLFSQDVSARKFNVLVTTYEFIMFDRTKLSKVDWKYIIIDEAQRMKDRDSVLARDLDRYRCQRRLLLTGTPLQNDLKELWSLLNLLLPEVFDNRKAFHDWFSKPFQKEGPSNDAEDDWLETEKKVIIIHRLHQILEPFMLRRRVEDVEGSLPPKVSIVLRCRMSAFQSAIYDWIKSTGTIRVDPDDEMRKAERSPMYQPRVYKPLNNRCMELRKTCNHPLLNYPNYLDLSKDFLVRSCGKLWILDRILIKLQRTGHRVLLFSTMTRLLDIMEEYLQWRRLVYRRIDGTTSLEDRESAIVDFNSRDSDCFIFLLSIRAAGRGLNLQTADTVIIYDPDPNPKNEEQAVARAHRIGQTREVKVIYLEAVVDKISSHQKEDEIRSGGFVDLEDDFAGKDRYMGSIESLIRNNIQQYKIDMADEVINAGRFDQRTTHEERRMTLETLLHDEERYQETVHDVPSLQQVNRMIARSEDEVELFDQMDEEMEWIEEMTSFNQVPKWIRACTKELNSTIASLSKKPSKTLLLGDGLNQGTNEIENERKRMRPKGKKVPNYKEIDDEIVDYSEASSEERNDYSAMEEEGEHREFDDDGSSGAVDVQTENKEQSEDDVPAFGNRFEFQLASNCNRAKLEMEEAGSSSSSSGGRRKARMMSPVSPQKFGSLSALDARPGSVSKKIQDELEEGEIVVSGDSHMDHQQSESWVLERDDGEEEQVLQPTIRRKRSIRIRPRYNSERLEERPEQRPGDSSPTPLLAEHKVQALPRGNSETKMLKEQKAARQDNNASVKSRQVFPSRKMVNTPNLDSPKSSKLNTQAKLAEDHFDRSRESWDGKCAPGTSVSGTKMSDVIQRRCKNVVSKLQRKISKEGPQIVPLLTTLWKKVEVSGFKSGSTLSDLRKIEQRVDRLEYNTVTELVFDVQFMLKGAMDYYHFSHEVRSEARKVHDLFFDILKIAFPDTDLLEARKALTFSAGASTNPAGAAAARPGGAAQGKKYKLKDMECDIGSGPNLKPMQRSSLSSAEEPKVVRVQIPSKESKPATGGASVSNREQYHLDEAPLHPGDLVICKKKRKDRDKPLMKPKTTAPVTPLSPPGSSHNLKSPFSSSLLKDARLSQPITHPQGWGTPPQPANCAGGAVGWANPVKRLRTDSGKRRPSHL